MTIAMTQRKSMKSKHQRLVLILLALAAMIAAALLAMSALKNQADFFYYPRDALAAHLAPGRAVRIGGMVVPGSIKRRPDGVTIDFVLSDGKAQVPATFSGIVPDLFRENSFATTQGSFDANGTFQVTELLAKHDERYMPKEMGGLRYDEKTHSVEPAKQ